MNQSGDLRVVASEEAGVTEPKLPWFKYRYGKVRRPLFHFPLPPDDIFERVRLLIGMRFIQELPPNADGEARDRYLAAIRSIPCTFSSQPHPRSSCDEILTRFSSQQGPLPNALNSSKKLSLKITESSLKQRRGGASVLDLVPRAAC